MHIQERIESAMNDGWTVNKISNTVYEFHNGVCKYTLVTDDLGNIKNN